MDPRFPRPLPARHPRPGERVRARAGRRPRRGGIRGDSRRDAYPVLLRLEGRGFVRATRVSSTLGPVRKYYELTPLGVEEALRRRDEWRSFRDAVERVVSGATADAGSEESNR